MGGWLLIGPNTIGNDYPRVQIYGSQTLRFYTRHGIEPMWYPHLAGGVPIGFLPFAQYFHLPAWLSSQLPGYWTGDALLIHSARHLLLLAAYHALLAWAASRLLGCGREWGTLLGFPLVYSLKTLDSLRYGPALEATVYGHAAILLALEYQARPRRGILFFVGACVYLLVTCGYPALIPFALLAGAAGWLVVARVEKISWTGSLVRATTILGAGILGLLLAAPHWVAFAEWARSAPQRQFTSFSAGAWSMGFRGPFINLFLPWDAEVHSAFGGATLLAIVVAGVALRCIAQPRHQWPAAILLGVPFLYSFGRRSPIFLLLQAFVPGLSGLRVPGRILSFLPIVLILALYWTQRRGDPRILQRVDAWAARATLGGCLLAAALTLLAPQLSAPANDALTPATLNSAWSPQLRLAWLGLGVMASSALIVCRERRRLALVLLGATVVQAGIVFHFGTWLERKSPAPTDLDFLSANHLPLYGTPPLRVDNEPFIGGFYGGTTQYVRFHEVLAQNVTRHLPVKAPASLEDIVLPFYLSIPNCALSELAADARLAFEAVHTQSPHAATATRASCDRDVDPAPSGPLLAARLVELNENNAVRSLTPNRLVMTVLASAPAVLVTPFPWIRRTWQARMDNTSVPVVSVNGAFVGVDVPPGEHQIELSYFSGAMVRAYRVTAGTAALSAFLIALFAGSRKRRLAVALLSVIALSAPALVLYQQWERTFVNRAAADFQLPNTYMLLLRRQLSLWRTLALPGTTNTIAPR